MLHYVTPQYPLRFDYRMTIFILKSTLKILVITHGTLIPLSVYIFRSHNMIIPFTLHVIHEYDKFRDLV